MVNPNQELLLAAVDEMQPAGGEAVDTQRLSTQLGWGCHAVDDVVGRLVAAGLLLAERTTPEAVNGWTNIRRPRDETERMPGGCTA